jgi:Asp-tRNA(Asn)/Glu-tRNA(Gln) amidotransferase A subunit family amidase
MRGFITFFAGAVLTLALLFITGQLSFHGNSHTRSAAEAYTSLIDLPLTASELDSLTPDLGDFKTGYAGIRSQAFPNALAFPMVFDPAPGVSFPASPSDKNPAWLASINPESISSENLAFLSATELSVLIRTRKITSTELTTLYLDRLKKHNDSLECVITLLEESALAAAAKADAEIAAGNYRGPLHGLPYGIKDLFAVRGTKTTWGSVPFKDQVIDETATIVQKLDEAGAILVAKLTLGELAWGDVWFGGMTRNPWNRKRGSSGSSAGSASATAAGLVAFAIGTETWGSIVSPSTECGVSGLRPSFGTVSRHGGMVLSWSMDKPGPIARSVNDLALVYDVIRGADAKDAATRDIAFTFNPGNKAFRLGVADSLFSRKYRMHANDSTALEALRNAGTTLVSKTWPEVPAGMDIILSAEAGAAFDELVRSNKDDQLVRQIRNAWPNVFRASRFIPAVEYIQASRIRTTLIAQTEALFTDVDVIVTPSFAGSQLLLTNLTGHPCVVVPTGFDERGNPTSITFVGKLFADSKVLEAAAWYQQLTAHHKKVPPAFAL